MVNINGKEWTKLEAADIVEALSEIDATESFYYEFKTDDVSNKKLIAEISAFTNTFGGYIFLGVSDDKQIKGCVQWNEQKIHTTIHDSITPTPSFDVKQFTFDDGVVYVIKIDEGAEPPYITNLGKIYERLSSGSFVINDSAKLSQIYNKREQQLAKMEKKISIPPLPERVNNIYGYIDIGFSLVTSDIQIVLDVFNGIDFVKIGQDISKKMKDYSISRIGESIVFSLGGISTSNGHLPAHLNNFLEVMADGSAKMRILLHNNNESNTSVGMMFACTVLQLFQELYEKMMGDLFPYKVAYAKKYESLTVIQQFHPLPLFDETSIRINPALRGENEKMMTKLQDYQKALGVTTVITDNRIPKTGLYTIDKRQLERWGKEYTAEAFIDELFLTQFVVMGFPSSDKGVGE